MTHWYHDPQRAEAVAAEYVLGTLQGPARRRFEALLSAHPDLRSHVCYWEETLNQLAEQVLPVSPKPAVWSQIQQRLFEKTSSPKPGWFAYNVWRLLAAANGLVALSLALFLWWTPRDPPGHVLMIVDKTSQQPMWVASTSSDMGRFYIKNLKVPDMPTDKPMRCMLWLQPEGSENFYAIGTLPDKGDKKVLTVDKAMRPKMPAQLWVTVEQMGDTLPDVPSSPIAYQGQWVLLNQSRG